MNHVLCPSCGSTDVKKPHLQKLMRVISVVIILGFIGLIVGFALSLPSLRQSEPVSPTVPHSRVPTPARSPMTGRGGYRKKRQA